MMVYETQLTRSIELHNLCPDVIWFMNKRNMAWVGYVASKGG